MSFIWKHELMSLGTKYSTVSTAHSWISCTARLQHHPTGAALLKTLNTFWKMLWLPQRHNTDIHSLLLYLSGELTSFGCSCPFSLVQTQGTSWTAGPTHQCSHRTSISQCHSQGESRGTSPHPQGHQEPAAAQDTMSRRLLSTSKDGGCTTSGPTFASASHTDSRQRFPELLSSRMAPAYIHFASPGALPLYEAESYNQIMAFSFIW